MKTREQIYGREAAELLRLISSYHCVMRDQLVRMFPGKESKLNNLINHLLRQGRIFSNPERADVFFDSPDTEYDSDMISAIWICCDFAERVEYHCAGDYPVKLSFFSDGELYDVIVIPKGKEALVNCAIEVSEDDGKRIVVLEDIGQAEQINVPNIAAFCLVDQITGKTEYYTLEG